MHTDPRSPVGLSCRYADALLGGAFIVAAAAYVVVRGGGRTTLLLEATLPVLVGLGLIWYGVGRASRDTDPRHSTIVAAE